nr:MAG TPA: hypothetical protein [Caudoviricetes sp.]
MTTLETQNLSNLEKELTEVEEKTFLLISFITLYKQYDNLPRKERKLVLKQHKLAYKYYATLKKRIKLIKSR